MIDQQIFEIGLSMSKAIIENPDNYKRDIEDVRKQMEKLQMERLIYLLKTIYQLTIWILNMNVVNVKTLGIYPMGEM